MQILNPKNIICFFVIVMLSSVAHGKFYRWVDENGKVHYSDKLPAERASGAHDQINQDGVSLDSVDRDKTAEERANEKALSAKEIEERKRQASIEAKQRAKDKILLDIFSSEADLLYTREDRLTAIESLINLTKLNNKRLNERLKVSMQTQERLLNAKAKVPKNIKDKIASTQKQIDKNDAYIKSQQANYEKIDKEFAADLIRYRELKNITPPAQVPASESAKNSDGDEKKASATGTATNPPSGVASPKG